MNGLANCKFTAKNCFHVNLFLNLRLQLLSFVSTLCTKVQTKANTFTVVDITFICNFRILSSYVINFFQEFVANLWKVHL